MAIQKTSSFTYQIVDSIHELNAQDADLLNQAKQVALKAYAPYSNFCVGAAAILNNGTIVTGTNQENASSPVGICAERVLLSYAVMAYGVLPITTMAISYIKFNQDFSSNKPITPCGMCRQSLAEYEDRTNQPIRLILGGAQGQIWIIETVKDILPFSFSRTDVG